jgi:hypothetical protein
VPVESEFTVEAAPRRATGMVGSSRFRGRLTRSAAEADAA